MLCKILNYSNKILLLTTNQHYRDNNSFFVQRSQKKLNAVLYEILMMKAVVIGKFRHFNFLHLFIFFNNKSNKKSSWDKKIRKIYVNVNSKHDLIKYKFTILSNFGGSAKIVLMEDGLKKHSCHDL